MPESELDRREIGRFQELFGCPPGLRVVSPGRANLIGEHTDYNGGFVFPMNVNRTVRFTVAKAKEKTVRLYSATYGESVEFPLKQLKRTRHWSDYVKGVISELVKGGHAVGGFQGLISGDLPIGSGLSSSAAFEMAVSEACAGLFGYTLDPPEQIKICWRAENYFVKVTCGIMDQFVIRLGSKNHGLFLDCRSQEYELVSIPGDGIVFIITNSGVGRDIGATAYTERQKQCEKGRLFFASINKSLRSLRDVDEGLLMAFRDKMDPVIFRRCRHVITENNRVKAAVKSLKKPDMYLFGELMNLSHESCKKDFEVSCRELDLLVDLARKVPGVLGSRMTGAGFGGCTISLVMRNRVDEFIHQVGSLYHSSTGIEPQFYVTHAENGVQAENL